MPTAKAKARARKDAREGKSASTQAGEFVREEIEEIRKGKHGARSPQQAIAIGLSEARRAGVKLPPYKGQKTKTASSGGAKKRPSAKRSRATLNALKREPRSTVSKSALSKQARSAATKRGAANRHQAAMKAVRTKGHATMSRAARKGAQTRQSHASH